jgi:hypothetical protein
MSARMSPEGCVLSPLPYSLLRDNLLSKVHDSDYHADNIGASKNGKFPETLSVMLQTSPAKPNINWCSQFMDLLLTKRWNWFQVRCEN